MSESSNTTHFGYKDVPTDDKVKMVRGVFDSVAIKYDLMNDLMSFGIHRIWKRITIQLSGVREGSQVLDLAGGTGDLTRLFSRKVGKSGNIILSDINNAMLSVGRDRLTDEGIVENVRYVQANAEALPFADNSFDCITIAFGLRNVTDKAAALKSMYRVLKPGGRLLVLEFSQPQGALVKKTYDFYSFSLLPKLGKLFAGDADSYQYLAESIRMHPDQETLKTMVEEAGFDRCEYFNLTQGVVALHRGFKY
jgi:demethylmenaquinone methyltransferase/2-methoxy-6-polyprenyl-1,4-benzoquinol methylase